MPVMDYNIMMMSVAAVRVCATPWLAAGWPLWEAALLLQPWPSLL
jgi:hypothetical protein